MWRIGRLHATFSSWTTHRPCVLQRLPAPALPFALTAIRLSEDPGNFRAANQALTILWQPVRAAFFLTPDGDDVERRNSGSTNGGAWDSDEAIRARGARSEASPSQSAQEKDGSVFISFGRLM